MRIAFVADVHAGNHGRCGGPLVAGVNRRCRDVVGALQDAATIARRERCEAFVVLGDLFDQARPPPQVIAAVQRVLSGAPNPVLLVGNHDLTSTEPGDHALGPLAPVAQVVERPEVLRFGDVELVLVPFAPGAALEVLRVGVAGVQAQRSSKGTVQVLGFHAGISDHRTPAFLAGAQDQVGVEDLRGFMDEVGLAGAVAGNWHEHRTWEHGRQPSIVQVGALAPTGWDNPGPLHYGWMAILEGATPRWRCLRVPGPRFLDVGSASELAAAVSGSGPGLRHYVRWVAAAASLEEARAEMRSTIAAGAIVDGVVEPDHTEHRAKVEAAAEAAREASTLEEALAEYVAGMPIPAGMDPTTEWRPDVLAKVRRYLGM